MAFKLSDEKSKLYLEFTTETHPVTGPLPPLRYPVIGLWQHAGTIIRAYLEASEIPVEHGEIGLFRWEPAITPLRARFWYYNVPGGLGLYLKPALVTRMARSGDDVPQILEDMCGNFPPMSLKDLIKSHL